jgi:hypothetical protein
LRLHDWSFAMNDHFSLVLGLLLTVLLAQGCATEPGAGLNYRDDLVAEIKTVQETLDHTNDSLGRTLELYNAILHTETTDPRTAYQNLALDLKSCEQQAQRVLDDIAEMEGASDEFFTNWNDELGSYQSPRMRERSQARLQKSQRRYERIMTALRPAKATFEVFFASLSDQVLFLGHDLTPDSIASLSADAEGLNRDATTVLDALQETSKAAAFFVQSIDSEAAEIRAEVEEEDRRAEEEQREKEEEAALEEEQESDS